MDRREAFKTLISILCALTEHPSEAAKVPRSQCPICKGTGFVKAGDGTVEVLRECTNCFADAPKVETKAETVRYMVVHVTDNCVFCDRLKQNVLKRFKKPVRIIKNDSKIALFPTIVLYESTGGIIKELKRVQGYIGWRQWNEMFYYDRKSAKDLREWCKRVNVQPVGVVNMTYQAHMTDESAEKHSVVFEDWQLEGLTMAELSEIHGAQHAGAISVMKD